MNEKQKQEFDNLKKLLPNLFENWFKSKYTEFNIKDFKELDFIGELELEKEDVDKYIDSIINIPPNFMENLVKYIAFRYKADFLGDASPFAINIKFSMNRMPNALNWVRVNVKELNIFEISCSIEPFNQCRWCGKPNSYINFEMNNLKIDFDRKNKYCHSCKKMDKMDRQYDSRTNPQHHKNCCYGEWAAKKKELLQKLKISEKTQNEKIQIFIDFCEELLKHNQDIEYTIQTENQKAVHEDDWIEYFSDK